jgi:hypothetical protein
VLVASHTAYVAGRLDDDEQRLLLTAKLAEIEERQLKLGQMAEFLRSKLSDLPPDTAEAREAISLG